MSDIKRDIETVITASQRHRPIGVTFVQRLLKCGYNHGVKVINEMERKGFIDECPIMPRRFYLRQENNNG